MTAPEIMKAAVEMRHGNKAYCSNAYYTLPQLEDFLHQPSVTLQVKEDCILLLQEDGELYRLQFYARSVSALQALAPVLSALNKPIVIDIVGRDPAAGQLAATVAENSVFRSYDRFVRMTCTEPLLSCKENNPPVELACASDVDEIDSALRNQFDPLVAHIPTREEFLQAIEQKEITVIRSENGLGGLAYFEKVSEKYRILRYFWVSPSCRGQNLAGALLYHTFCQQKDDGPKQVYMLWVGCENPAQQLYLKYQFQYDGLQDYILLYRPDQKL